MNLRDAAALLAFMRLPAAGNAIARKLLIAAEHMGRTPASMFDVPPHDLIEGLPHGDLQQLAKRLSEVERGDIDRAERQIERLTRHGVHLYVATSGDYPPSLSHYLRTSAPAMIFCAGNTDLLAVEGAAIVGSRNVSQSGAALAADCARWFVRESIPIVSGGATGADSAAHDAALDAGGATIIVLPQGIRTFRGPRAWMEAVEEGRALLLSEFDPDLPWTTRAAIVRNTTICALARLVCVIEPRSSGGSMRTARRAIELGKPVFFHCGKDVSARDQLAQSGARPLLGHNGSIDEARLRIAMTSRPESVPLQFDLF